MTKKELTMSYRARGGAIAQAKRTIKHKFLTWLSNMGWSLAEWAKANGLSRSKPQSWVLRDPKQRRRCPDEWRVKIEHQSGGLVPEKCWDSDE